MAKEDDTWIVPSVFDRLLGAPRVSTDHWQFREALDEIRMVLGRLEIPENEESMLRFVQTDYREWLEHVEAAESAILTEPSISSSLAAVRRALEQCGVTTETARRFFRLRTFIVLFTSHSRSW